MLRTGKEHLESLRDGRVVYVGSERVDDVTRHPAFCNAAATVAAIYDMKADPANRDTMTYEEDGGRHSIYFLRPRTRDDLQRRMVGHRRIADLTFGMFGRSPDHVASFVTGMAMKPDALPAPCGHAGQSLGLLPPHPRPRYLRGLRGGAAAGRAQSRVLSASRTSRCRRLRVVREDDDGVVISGMKMLATGALYANEIWIGNVIPLAPDQKKEAITCAVPCNAPGLTLWSRKPAALGATSEFDSPLAWRYDESDSMLMCDNVKVPWERVFVHDDALLSRDIYIKTPSHCFGNHQSNVRYWSKMRLLLGLCSKIAQATGADQVPAVRETLGKMAAVESTHRRAGARPDQRLRELARRLCLLQPPLHVCGARLVHAELQQVHRRAARAVRRRRVPDAGRHLGDGRSRSWRSSSRPIGRRRRPTPSPA